MVRALGKTASNKLLPAQPGDVEETCADISALSAATGYAPAVSIEEGLRRFAQWYLNYYHAK